ncbi:MAG: 3-oxoacid CoA-transferase subunit A [Bacteroidales bacterium]|jgi:acetate CoA/acetoacetate CoA-transferase alpha subunit|nr:3-oxoacid CoA-transferase subunit A [Bacteroidales bacterium]MBO4876344.1 3-oxoacid CoA-transferase subunit A [Bacteroidales bacterium]MBO7133377.1 3-oxoacid CoA-transferase subunit A [Bacteroidales bacterium]MBO7571771.1 3-oxoacid CoA-transferase subunit A [Bacteroidales bacterium]MBQ2575631.1 3-oxoacid CoA-transferase subunit A [Bacteroidales bacterium]
MDKFISVEQAVSMVKDGMTLMIGGFLGVGSANKVLKGIHDAGIKNLTIIGNDTAFVDKGVGILVANHQVKKAIVSHIGTNPETIAQLNSKELEIEFVPQGTLAERIRCGGAGLGGVLTPTGLGTVVAEGKRVINVDGKDYLLELPIHADIALLGATVGDETGNLVFKGTTQNFNPMMAMAADVVIAEIENIVKVGEIAPEAIHTQNIFVDYIVK